MERGGVPVGRCAPLFACEIGPVIVCKFVCNFARASVFFGVTAPPTNSASIALKPLKYKGKAPEPAWILRPCYGGGGGSRTPVRKHIRPNFSGRRRLLCKPHAHCSRRTRQAVTPQSPVASLCMVRSKLCARTDAANRRSPPARGPSGENGHCLSSDRNRLIVVL